MLLSLVTAGAAFATTLPEWISANVHTVLGEQTLSVTGKDASAAVSALAIVAVVGAFALRISGKKVRLAISAIMVAAGIGIAFAAWGVVQNPAQASLSTISKVTGTNSTEGTFTLSALPWVCMAAALLLTLAALWAGFASRNWQDKRKYERRTVPALDEDLDEIDTWDSLSAGVDPTERH